MQVHRRAGSESSRAERGGRGGRSTVCVLEGGIDSDLPGPIRARVRQNVYDSPTGRFLLILQGTLLTGEYSSEVTFGQSRVLVAERRLIFPDASSLLLRGMPLVDLEGYSGVESAPRLPWQP